MKAFLKSWLRDTFWYVLSTTGTILLILSFGIVAVTYWPDYAWENTAAFTFFILATVFFIIWKKR